MSQYSNSAHVVMNKGASHWFSIADRRLLHYWKEDRSIGSDRHIAWPVRLLDVHNLSSCDCDRLNISVHTTTEHGASELLLRVDKGRGSIHIQPAFSLITCDNHSEKRSELNVDTR
jgi:hypothetical protein